MNGSPSEPFGSAALYQALIEASPDAILVAEEDGDRYILTNAAAERLLGYSREELSRLGPADIAAPDDLWRLEPAATTLHTIGEWQGEWSYRRQDGAIVVTDTSTRRLIVDGRRLHQSRLRDITERKWVESVLAGQTRVLEAIARGAGLSEVLDSLVRMIEAQTDGMLCTVLLLDESGTRLRHGAAPSLPDSFTLAVDGLAIGPSVGSCGAAAYLCEPVITEDVTTDPRWENWVELALRHGLRACWSTPILASQGHVLGTFAMYYREPRRPGAREWRLIEMATQLAGIAIERTQRVRTLREREARLRLLAQQLPAIIWTTDRDLRVTSVSGAGLAMADFEAEELVGVSVPDFFAAEGGDLPVNALRSALAGQTVEHELRLRGRAYEVLLAPLLAEAGETAGVVGLAIDITERVERRRRLEALLRVARRFSESVDAGQMFATLLDEAMRVLAAEGGAVYSWDDDSRRLTAIRVAGPPGRFERVVARGQGPVGEVAESREIRLADSGPTPPAPDRSGEVSSARAVVAVPILHEGTLLGVLAVSAADPEQRFGQEEIEVLELLASSAAVALTGLERAQLRAVTLAARDLAHRLNNDLALAIGTLEIVQRQAELSDRVLRLLGESIESLVAASGYIQQFQQLVRFRTKETPIGQVLDVDRSARGQEA